MTTPSMARGSVTAISHLALTPFNNDNVFFCNYSRRALVIQYMQDASNFLVAGIKRR